MNRSTATATSVAMGLALLLPSIAGAQSDYQWAAFNHVGDGTDAPLVVATFGVPETDDTAIHLTCAVQDAVPVVQALFSAPTGNLEAGSLHPFRWRTDLGAVEQHAMITLGEEFGGVALTLSLDSILLQQLSVASGISYGLSELTEFSDVVLTLSPNQAEVTGFIENCQTIAAPTPGNSGQVAGFTPNFGPNITGHDWSRFTEVSENVFETILTVTYGVPETDDVLVIGECFIGAQGPLVALQVGADIDGLTEGASTSLRVSSANGQHADIAGHVIGTFAEVGISGVEMILEASDPAWSVIAGDATVRFERLGARGGFTLTGNGVATLASFLTDCEQIDQLTPESSAGAATPASAQDGYLSCDNLGRVASADVAAPVALTFRNESGAFRTLAWIDAAGNVIDQGGMNAGEELSFTTGSGHVWMAIDGSGTCREMIQPVAGQTRYEISER